MRGVGRDMSNTGSMLLQPASPSPGASSRRVPAMVLLPVSRQRQQACLCRPLQVPPSLLLPSPPGRHGMRSCVREAVLPSCLSPKNKQEASTSLGKKFQVIGERRFRESAGRLPHTWSQVFCVCVCVWGKRWMKGWSQRDRDMKHNAQMRAPHHNTCHTESRCVSGRVPSSSLSPK